jgi:hypothetical protein
MESILKKSGTQDAFKLAKKAVVMASGIKQVYLALNGLAIS